MSFLDPFFLNSLQFFWKKSVFENQAWQAFHIQISFFEGS